MNNQMNGPNHKAGANKKKKARAAKKSKLTAKKGQEHKTAPALAQTASEETCRSAAQSARLVNDVPADLLSEIKGLLAQHEQPFIPSVLYEVASELKVHDESRRKSTFRAIVEHELFVMCEQLVAAINLGDEHLSYSLVRNDVTQIKYASGDFFDVHQVKNRARPSPHI
jgi:hypothetical protein